MISETRLQQGYLANQKNASVRIRTGNGKSPSEHQKHYAGYTETEFEYEIPLADAREMLREIAIQPLSIRHGISFAMVHDWELDVFEGENHGLIVMNWNWNLKMNL